MEGIILKLYIVRHGETEWNKEKKLQGWQNSNLTEDGIASAKLLRKRLENINFDFVYSSPQTRAIETAGYIKKEGEKLIILDEIKEMGFGEWQGLENEKLQSLYGEEYYNFWERPHLYKTCGGETFEELQSRVEVGINKVIQNGGENVLIISHGVVIKAIQVMVKGYSLEEFWTPPVLENTSLTLLEFRDGKLNMILDADTSHL